MGWLSASSGALSPDRNDCTCQRLTARRASWNAASYDVITLVLLSNRGRRAPDLILMKDEPVHVESVSTDEIAENLTESPGNVASIFLELPGMHVESVAAGLGGAAMQLRGMPSRDTLVLVDGLPLLGAEPDGFGILQTPPLDLERAEVIKGAASAL